MPQRTGLSTQQWTVVLAALGLALVLFVYGIGLPPTLRSKGDAGTYMLAALRLRTLPGIWHYVGDRSIGMPLFDAAVRALVLAVSSHAVWARWVDALSWTLFTIHVFAAAAFTRFVWTLGVLQSRWAAVALWALLASCPALIGHTTTPLTDTLAIDVVLLGLVALRVGLGTSRLGWALPCVAIAGVACAFSVLLRPAFLAGVGALLLAACFSQLGTGLRKLLLPTAMLLCCLGTLAPFSLQCARMHGGGLCLQPATTFDAVRHAQVGLRGGRVLWRHAAAPGDILPMLPDAFMVEHFYAPCRLTHITGTDASSLSGCLLSRPLLTPVLIVKKWIALFDHFRFTPYVEHLTPAWLRWLSLSYDLLFWLGFALLPVWALASLRPLRLTKLTAALRNHAPLSALIAFSLVMLAEHTALHTEERFSLPLLPLCALSLVAYLDRAHSRFAREGMRAAWPISGYAALTCAIFVFQVMAWDGQMRATATTTATQGSARGQVVKSGGGWPAAPAPVALPRVSSRRSSANVAVQPTFQDGTRQARCLVRSEPYGKYGDATIASIRCIIRSGGRRGGELGRAARASDGTSSHWRVRETPDSERPTRWHAV